MLTKEFNALALSERSTLVFAEGKLIDIYEEKNIKKAFYYTLNNLKIDVIYDLFSQRLLEITAWDNACERKIV